jgi:hypothetical protein
MPSTFSIRTVGCAGCRLGQDQHAIANGRRKLLDAVEKLGLLRRWRSLKLLRCQGETRTHQGQRALNALVIIGAAMSSLARSLQVADLNNFAHFCATLPGFEG